MQRMPGTYLQRTTDESLSVHLMPLDRKDLKGTEP